MINVVIVTEVSRLSRHYVHVNVRHTLPSVFAVLVRQDINDSSLRTPNLTWIAIVKLLLS